MCYAFGKAEGDRVLWEDNICQIYFLQKESEIGGRWEMGGGRWEVL